MLRAFAIAALACLSLPAAAEDKPLVDHFAAVFIGIGVGSHSYVKETLVPVRQLGPGVFEIASEGQRTTTETITEIEPCVFNYASQIGTRVREPLQYYMSKLKSLSYRAGRTDENGMTIQFYEIEFDPGFVARDGEPVDTKLLLHSVDTDIPVESLNASVAALKAACP